MKRRLINPSRQGFTLVEMVASLAGAAALMAGMGATLAIAMRSSDPSQTPAVKMLEASECLADWSADLQYALSISESTATAITFTVPDRNDADANPETIRYAWSGTPGGPLTRQFNSGAVINVLTGVDSVAIEYQPSAAAAKYVTVRIRRTAGAGTTVETSTTLMNRL